MEVSARIQSQTTQPPALQAQTSNSGKQKAPFNPAELKEEQAALGAAREMAEAVSEEAISERSSTNLSEVQNTKSARQNAEWSRTEGAPNWSTLSASSKGYTFADRAINLYRHIHAMAV